MTMDKEMRKVLVERYLEGDTSPREERELLEWYETHQVDRDEWADAMLIRLSAPCGDNLSETDETETEFDRILALAEKKKHRVIIRRVSLVVGAIAAAVAILLILTTPRTYPENILTPIQIAEGIQQIMLLDIEDIESVEATPKGAYAILTARLKDGSTCSYILTYNGEGTSLALSATNLK